MLLAELPFPFLDRTAQLQSPFFQGSSCRRRLVGDDRVRVRVRVRGVAMLVVSIHSDAANAAADVLLTEGCVSSAWFLLCFINAASEA